MTTGPIRQKAQEMMPPTETPNEIFEKHFFSSASGEPAAAHGSLEERMLTAVRTYDSEMLYALLEQGANVNYQDQFGCTALHYIAACGARPCLRVLLRRTDVDYVVQNKLGQYPSGLAFLCDNISMGMLFSKKQAIQAWQRGIPAWQPRANSPE